MSSSAGGPIAAGAFDLSSGDVAWISAAAAAADLGTLVTLDVVREG